MKAPLHSASSVGNEEEIIEVSNEFEELLPCQFIGDDREEESTDARGSAEAEGHPSELV
jgi:hypothetical protein